MEKMTQNSKNVLKANKEYLLLSVVYDSKSNGAGLKFLDVEKGKLIYITDPFHHEPYCLSFESPDKLKGRKFPPGIVKRIDMIHKRDLLQDIDVTLAQIITPTPSEVPKVREILGETWESRIKYHRNWIYDMQLIPGRKYLWSSEKQCFQTSQSQGSRLEIPKQIMDQLGDYGDLLQNFLPDFTQEIPEIPVVACDIETEYVEDQMPQATDPKFRITCICLTDNNDKSVALVLERKGVNKGVKTQETSFSTEVHHFKDETLLIRQAFDIINQYSICVTFNGDNFDFPYLYERARVLKVKGDSPIIWNRRTRECKLKNGIHIDIYRFYRNVAIRAYAFGNKYREGNLDSIASALLGIGKVKIDKEIKDLTEWELIYYCSRDAKITLDLLLFDNKTPLNLIFILSRITRTPIDDLTRTAVSNWVQSLFYSEHRRKGYLIPNSEDIQEQKGIFRSSEAMIKGKKYKGAIVIDPVPGIHFNVTVLDFASLYPSIIGAHNLSYETILCSHPDCKENKVPQTPYWVCKEKRGVIADIIGFIKDIRVHWLKPESKRESPQKKFYGILEKSLKVLINASYGVLGSDRFPLYCLPVADSTTAYGRDSIERTIAKAKVLSVKVLYGDTDSVFLLSPTQKQINEIVEWSQHELGVGLEVEKTYRYIVFSKRKKNYFGVYPNSDIDVKGLMGKKRNTPPFLQQAFQDVMKILSNVKTIEDFETAITEIKTYVRSVYQKLERGKYSNFDLAVTMQITQPLKRYLVRSQHVKAAYQLEDHFQSNYKREHDGKIRRAPFIKAGKFIRFIKTRNKDRVTALELMSPKSRIDVKAYRSMIDTIFEQIFDSLDVELQELSSGQVNLMEFFG
jgi:DNA polymerase I